jgi:predicted phage gp36 major capsid-like protein
MDLIEVDKGLMSKVEYRMKWRGETQAQAEQALKDIQGEAEQNLMLQQKYVTKPTSELTDAAATQEKLQSSNKSSQVTKNDGGPKNN